MFEFDLFVLLMIVMIRVVSEIRCKGWKMIILMFLFLVMLVWMCFRKFISVSKRGVVLMEEVMVVVMMRLRE